MHHTYLSPYSGGPVLLGLHTAFHAGRRADQLAPINAGWAQSPRRADYLDLIAKPAGVQAVPLHQWAVHGARSERWRRSSLAAPVGWVRKRFPMRLAPHEWQEHHYYDEHE